MIFNIIKFNDETLSILLLRIILIKKYIKYTLWSSLRKREVATCVHIDNPLILLSLPRLTQYALF